MYSSKIMQGILRFFDPILRVGFYAHDRLADFLAKHFTQVKFFLLLVAHVSLFGFFFPDMRREFGSLARTLLLFILFLSPLSKIFRIRLLAQLMGLRRQLGIWFAYLASVHSLGYVFDPLWSDFIFHSQAEGPFGIQPTYFFGSIAYVLTIPLLVTSNNFSVRLLRVNWKRVQALVYPVLFFTLLHSFLLSRTGKLDGTLVSIGLIQTALVVGVYAFLKLLARKNVWAGLIQFNDLVVERYVAYRAQSRVEKI